MPAMMPPEAMPTQPGAGAPPPAGGGEAAGPESGPQPPMDGYSKKSIMAVATALKKAVEAIKKATKADGLPDVALPDAKMFEGGKFAGPLPAPIVDLIKRLISVANDIGGKMEGRYAVDVLSMMADDAGLEKLAVLLELVARDKVLLDRMKEAQKAAGKAPAAKPVETAKQEAAEPAEEQTAAEEAGETHAKPGIKDYM